MSDFLVVYDYGTGGIWGIARAKSSAVINREFPELRVMEARPDWMSAEEQARIRSDGIFDVDDPSTYPAWLCAIIEDRQKS